MRTARARTVRRQPSTYKVQLYRSAERSRLSGYALTKITAPHYNPGPVPVICDIVQVPR